MNAPRNTKRQIRVVVTGSKGAGKDEFAKRLRPAISNLLDPLYPPKVWHLAHAEPLKNMLAALLSMRGVNQPTIQRMLHGDLKEEPTPLLCGKTPRHAMQTLGSEWGRECIGPELWVDTMVDRCKMVNYVTITDARFPNEVEAQIEQGAVVVHVHRPNNPFNNGDTHPSEQHASSLPYHFLVLNHGTLDHLEAMANEVAVRIIHGDPPLMVRPKPPPQTKKAQPNAEEVESVPVTPDRVVIVIDPGDGTGPRFTVKFGDRAREEDEDGRVNEAAYAAIVMLERFVEAT